MFTYVKKILFTQIVDVVLIHSFVQEPVAFFVCQHSIVSLTSNIFVSLSYIIIETH